MSKTVLLSPAVLRLAVLCGAASSGCSNETAPGSCFREHDNACVEYTTAQGAAGKRMCSGMKWTAGAATCPTANRLGTCVRGSGTEFLYAGAPNNYNAASAKTACEHDGSRFIAWSSELPASPSTSSKP
ncbi:MAG: hypothetical protein K0S65_3983 [Labilithrix sp.]|nr:hypothetical protein [Labilithrix sp.]